MSKMTVSALLVEIGIIKSRIEKREQIIAQLEQRVTPTVGEDLNWAYQMFGVGPPTNTPGSIDLAASILCRAVTSTKDCWVAAAVVKSLIDNRRELQLDREALHRAEIELSGS